MNSLFWFGHELDFSWVRTVTSCVAIGKSIIHTKLKRIDIFFSTDEIAENVH